MRHNNCLISYCHCNVLMCMMSDYVIQQAGDLVLREANYCVIDEVDSILIDEARTPLIISGPAEKPSEK